jgi:hypothetical protein
MFDPNIDALGLPVGSDPVTLTVRHILSNETDLFPHTSEGFNPVGRVQRSWM